MSPEMITGLWGAALVSAAAYLPLTEKPPSAVRTILKTLPLLLFSVIAVVSGGPLALVVALLLSALGDAWLAQDGNRAFMAGLASFLLAHLAYAGLFFAAGEGMAGAPVAATAAIAVFAIVFGMLLVRSAGPLAVPVALYVVAIAVMGFGAAGMGAAVLAGAALFMISDAILGAAKFLMKPAHPMRALAGAAIWVFYVAGQGLILRGIVG